MSILFDLRIYDLHGDKSLLWSEDIIQQGDEKPTITFRSKEKLKDNIQAWVESFHRHEALTKVF